MPNSNTEFVGRFISALVLLFVAIFFALISINGHGLEVYTSETQPFSVSFPPWDVQGSNFNGTENTSGDLVINGSSSGVYTYTSPVIDNAKLVQLSDLTYNADIPMANDQGITLKIYTSDDGFETIENTQSFQLRDGVGSRVIELAKERDYRFEVLLSYSGTGNEPVLNELVLNGVSVEKEEDFTPLFFTIAFWLLMVMSVLALVPRV